jgi:hypothetical protein
MILHYISSLDKYSSLSTEGWARPIGLGWRSGRRLRAAVVIILFLYPSSLEIDDPTTIRGMATILYLCLLLINAMRRLQ